MNISLLGTGLLGAAIAERLQHQTDFRVTIWNRNRDRAAIAARGNIGMSIANTAEKAIERSNITILTLSDAPAIESVLFTEEVMERMPGKIFIQMGTIAPEESRNIAAKIEEHEGKYLEAPVLGSIPEALEGRLIVMGGGTESLFNACMPVLSTLGTAPQLIGEVGQAATMKLAMNQLIASLTTGFALSLGLIRAEGVNIQQFMSLLRESSLYAPTFDKKLEQYMHSHYEKANFPLKHLVKDTALFARVAESHKIDRRMTFAMLSILEDGMKEGHSDEDYSSLYEAVNPKKITTKFTRKL